MLHDILFGKTTQFTSFSDVHDGTFNKRFHTHKITFTTCYNLDFAMFTVIKLTFFLD